jgi:hypothetical protein
MLRDEIASAIEKESHHPTAIVDGGCQTCKSAADAALAVFKEWLGRENVLEAIAEKQANGWVYGTHPKDKARIVVAAIIKELEK